MSLRATPIAMLAMLVACHEGESFSFGATLEGARATEVERGSERDAGPDLVTRVEPSAGCDAGSCAPARAPLGQPCSLGAECESGTCVDGVCCESACDGACQACGSSGYCDRFPALDEACAAVICSASATCESHEPPLLHACSGFGQCATSDHCVTRFAPRGVRCEEALLCDGIGGCALAEGEVVREATQVCPAPGTGPAEARVDVDGTGVGGEAVGEVLCWVAGDGIETQLMGGGRLLTGPLGEGVVVGAYIYASNPGVHQSVKTQAYDAAGVLLPGCVAVDDTKDAAWEEVLFTGPTCQNAAFARLTAHASPYGDL